MYFLIDYENVGDPGLKGAWWIDNTDHVYLFYHDNMKIASDKLKCLMEAKEYEAVKLMTIGNNALDMYISVKIGSIIEKDKKGKLVIISKDKDFRSVVEYCSFYGGMQHDIYTYDDIELAILGCDSGSERHTQLLKAKKRVSIEETYIIYKERRKMRDEVKAILAGSGYEDEIDKVCDILNTTETSKERYLMILRTLGKEKGNAIYRILKEAC